MLIVFALIAFFVKLFQSFAKRFVKKLYLDEPLRFILAKVAVGVTGISTMGALLNEFAAWPFSVVVREYL
ncbi:hypothetical protein BpHYR1_050408 [Brachionus plicatilis]|uniref:Uncharacterized protein n=1 Tax=Brachionus plicatilis TaxID=10195 RepID=A0A3M7SC87_BRAPC|nr:hypothetical protein BpHYR1_050408 [Brachionus plicatilis]